MTIKMTEERRITILLVDMTERPLASIQILSYTLHNIKSEYAALD